MKNLLKLEVLYDVVLRETEYALDIRYNDSEHWTVEERAESLIKCIKLYVNLEAHQIVENYGIDTFDESIQRLYDEVYNERHKIGDTININNDEGKIVFIPSIQKYGLIFNDNEIEYLNDSIDLLVLELKNEGVYKDE